MKLDYRSGFVVILGKPNVGKSTLLNRLIGEKLSIISDKPQTTRLALKGIYTDKDCQIVFLDTPGFLKPRYEMHHRMMKQVANTIKDADVILFMTAVVSFPSDYDSQLLDLLAGVNVPKLALINMCDLKNHVDKSLFRGKRFDGFEATLFISAATGDNIETIIPEVIKNLPFGPPLYDREHISDLPLRFFAQEIIREGIYKFYAQEIPYATAVVIDKYEENIDKHVIHATVWIEKDSQKPIIIGNRGSGLRQIREYAEDRLLTFNRIKTEVHLWVKIKKNWRKNNATLKELGFN